MIGLKLAVKGLDGKWGTFFWKLEEKIFLLPSNRMFVSTVNWDNTENTKYLYSMSSMTELRKILNSVGDAIWLVLDVYTKMKEESNEPKNKLFSFWIEFGGHETFFQATQCFQRYSLREMIKFWALQIQHSLKESKFWLQDPFLRCEKNLSQHLKHSLI